jgi:hypothetical protein
MGFHFLLPHPDLKLRLCGVCLANLSRLGRIYTLCSFGRGTCPDLRTDDVIPVHEDAQLHTAQRTRKLLQNVGGKTMGFLPFSPDFTPSDFYLFPTLK